MLWRWPGVNISERRICNGILLGFRSVNYEGFIATLL